LNSEHLDSIEQFLLLKIIRETFINPCKTYLSRKSSSAMPPPVQVALKPIAEPKIGENGYQGFQPGKTEVLPKGWNGFNAAALESDILIDHDVRIIGFLKFFVAIFREIITPPKALFPLQFVHKTL
jgi:hypothetical protein